MIGGLHSGGFAIDGGTGSFASSIACTFLGFALLFPMLAIGGVGVGDVKMQMGFGAWVGAYFGIDGASGLYGMGVVFWSFCVGAIAGGAFSMVMILIRRQFKQNMTMVSEILMDLQLFASGNTAQGSKRASERRDRWVKLPYGIPLCVGFLLFLWYALTLN
jgi:prepilin peptidase CpaA